MVQHQKLNAKKTMMRGSRCNRIWVTPGGVAETLRRIFNLNMGAAKSYEVLKPVTVDIDHSTGTVCWLSFFLNCTRCEKERKIEAFVKLCCLDS